MRLKRVEKGVNAKHIIRVIYYTHAYFDGYTKWLGQKCGHLACRLFEYIFFFYVQLLE